MHHAPFPWTAEGGNIRDRLGNVIAVFKDHRDATACASLFKEIEGLKHDVREVSLDYEATKAKLWDAEKTAGERKPGCTCDECS